MLKNFLIALTFFFICAINAQKEDILVFKNGIENTSLLSTHHFGIFFSRINTNFKHRPSKKNTLTFSYASGNNHHPYLEGYFPKDPEIRADLSNHQEAPWNTRQFEFIDQETTPADYMNIFIDAVIKEFRASVNIPINNKHEINVSLRSYLITEGKQWYSPLTSDETIEWFHSNIAGGEDPFARRYYGLNEVNFRYQDRNGNLLELNKNDFFISGFEVSHYYYPKLKINSTKKLFVNLGSHLGINTTKFNPSIDLGISSNIIKQFDLKNKKTINLAFGANLLRKNLINFDTPIELGNNPYLVTFEAAIEYSKQTKKGNYNSFTINYQNQTRLNKKEESNYYVLEKNVFRKTFMWYNGIDTLYKNLTNFNLIYTFTNHHYSLSLYVKQDTTVTNAPDLQTGIGVKIPLSK